MTVFMLTFDVLMILINLISCKHMHLRPGIMSWPKSQLGLFTVFISAGLLALLSLPYLQSCHLLKWQALVLGWKEPELTRV